ncbi:MAG: phage holin family protein [Ancrocorticia sp.]|uniref:phage holin family protein n=1 Tax=Ancrocorticia sp. TaxID=2593684 RepID=UPI003F916451
MKLLVRALVNALGLWVCVAVLSGITLIGTSDYVWLYYILAGIILAVVNVLIRPIVAFFSIPFYVLTLGLFFIVVNALMLGLTSWITGFFDVGIHVDGFIWAVIGGLIVGLINVVADLFLPLKYQRS